jgi:hypothetical protein
MPVTVPRSVTGLSIELELSEVTMPPEVEEAIRTEGELDVLGTSASAPMP